MNPRNSIKKMKKLWFKRLNWLQIAKKTGGPFKRESWSPAT